MYTDNVEVAYAAGFIDGEGCIYIAKERYELRFSISQTNPIPLYRIQDLFGGKIGNYKKRIGTNKPIYELKLTGRRAYNALKILRPYLIVKADESDLAIEYFEQTFNIEDNSSERDKYYLKMRSLKRVIFPVDGII